MNKNLLTVFRSAISVTLVVGSVFVQHVAREQQPEERYAGLQLRDRFGEELADYIVEGGKVVLALMR